MTVEIKKRVLLVEDDKDFLDLLRFFLSSCNSLVDSVQTCKQALQKCNDNEYDAVISDYHLSDAKAVEIAELLAKKNKPTKMLIMTGDTTQKRILETRADIDCVVLKPFKLDDLSGFLDGLKK